MIEFLRFPVKLTFALVAALMIGFHFNLETPRWAVMTAGIVAGGTAFAAGAIPILAHCAIAAFCASLVRLLAVLPPSLS